MHLDQSARHQWNLVRVSLDPHCKHVSRQLFLVVFHHASQILLSELFYAMGSSFEYPICPTQQVCTYRFTKTGWGTLVLVVSVNKIHTFIFSLLVLQGGGG